MPSRYYDDDDDDNETSRRYRRRRRDSSSRSPRRAPSSAYRPRSVQPPPLISGALPPDRSIPRLEVEPRGHFHDANALQVPVSRGRPRSLPAAAGPVGARRRGSSPSPRAPAERSRSPLDTVRHGLRDSFTDSSAGLGASVLGAIVGGLAAREASDVAARRRHGSHPPAGGSDKVRLVSTLVGAAVGGLGANALGRKLEDSKPNNFVLFFLHPAPMLRPHGMLTFGAAERNETRREHLAVDGRWGRVDRPESGGRPPHRGRRPGTAADYYDVHNGYDYVYERKISRRRSEDTFRPPK